MIEKLIEQYRNTPSQFVEVALDFPLARNHKWLFDAKGINASHLVEFDKSITSLYVLTHAILNKCNVVVTATNNNECNLIEEFIDAYIALLIIKQPSADNFARKITDGRKWRIGSGSIRLMPLESNLSASLQSIKGIGDCELIVLNADNPTDDEMQSLLELIRPTRFIQIGNPMSFAATQHKKPTAFMRMAKPIYRNLMRKAVL